MYRLLKIRIRKIIPHRRGRIIIAYTEEARGMVNDPNASAEEMQEMIDDLTAAEKALVNIVDLRDAVAG